MKSFNRMVHPYIFLVPRKNGIGQYCPDFIKKDEWPPNSPDLNPLDYHVGGAILWKYKAYTPKPTNMAMLKAVLEAIWENFSQDTLDQVGLAFRRKPAGVHASRR